jgi:peroxiredoxin
VELKTGDKAPEFALTDQSGATAKVEISSGRRVLVYFDSKSAG